LYPLCAEAEQWRVLRIQSRRKRDNSTPYVHRQSNGRGGCKGYRAGGKEITVPLMGRGRAVSGARIQRKRKRDDSTTYG
jgi:hypothetical protein